MAQHFEKSFAKLRSQNNPHVTPFKKYFEKCVKKYSQGFAPLFQKVDSNSRFITYCSNRIN